MCVVLCFQHVGTAPVAECHLCLTMRCRKPPGMSYKEFSLANLTSVRARLSPQGGRMLF